MFCAKSARHRGRGSAKLLSQTVRLGTLRTRGPAPRDVQLSNAHMIYKTIFIV